MSKDDTRTGEAFDHAMKALELVAAIRKVVTDPLLALGLDAAEEHLVQVVGRLSPINDPSPQK